LIAAERVGGLSLAELVMRFSPIGRVLIPIALSGPISSVFWSAVVRAEEQPVPSVEVDAARRHYDAGVAAYSAARFEEAVSEFLAADRLAPRAALSYNIARAYDKLGDVAKALRFYRDYLRRAPQASNAAETRTRMHELETALAAKGLQQVSVRSEPSGAELRIDERVVGTTPWAGELAPGTHRLTVNLEGYSELSRAFELPALESLDVELRLDAPAAPAPSAPVPSASETEAAGPPPRVAAKTPAAAPTARFGPWPWISLGAGAAALVGSLGFELSRRSAESDVENAAHRDYFDDYERMESRKNTARVLLGVGGALAVTGGVLLYLDRAALQSAALRCGPGSCVGHLESRF
jgi:tetratricopeptide (TPR) repeat protein